MRITSKIAVLSTVGIASAGLLSGATFAATPSTTSLEAIHPAMQQSLQIGSQGHWVCTLQADLNLLGYSAGPMDGIFGPRTERGLVAFEQAHALPDSVATTPVIWQDILAGFDIVPAAPESSPTTAQTLANTHPAMRQVLTIGSTGHWVMTLQANLEDLGYLPEGSDTGYFNAATETALKAFQKATGLAETGVTSEVTWQQMLSGFKLVPPISGTTAPTLASGTSTTGSTSTSGNTSSSINNGQSGPTLPEAFPEPNDPVSEPSLNSPSDGVTGEFTSSIKTIDGRPVLHAYHMVATSYGPSLADNYPYGPVDAFGQPLEDGMIAVDPSVIPLHSVLYVTGYHDNYLPSGGFMGEALDTGGAIQGDRVDLFINADPTVISDFGVQQVTVYTLGN